MARWHRPSAFGVSIALAVLSYGLYELLGQWGMKTPPSTAILAILVGLAAGNVITPPDWLRQGSRVIIKKWIPFAIVGIGAGLDLAILADPNIGLAGLVITLLGMGVAFGSAMLAGRLFGLKDKTSTLLGAGTAVCGNAAIVAVAPVIDAEDDDLVLSMGAVNLFGLLVTLALPALAIWLKLDDYAAGVWAGTSVHAVPQAIAAGAAVGDLSGEFAALFKLVRVAMLAPMVLIISFIIVRRRTDRDDHAAAPPGFLSLIPWFVWGFLIAGLLNTFGWLNLNLPAIPFFTESHAGDAVTLSAVLKTAGKWILTIAMAAIGMEIRLRGLVGVGGRAVLAGFVASLALLGATWGMIILWLQSATSQ